jgi:nicotinamide mononucleotide adenylyltransferase
MFNSNLNSLVYNFAQNVRLILVELFNVFYSYSFLSFFNATSLTSCLKAISLNFSFLNVFNFSTTSSYSEFSFNKSTNANVLNINHRLSTDDVNTYSEGTSSQRVNRFNTVFVNYDYKTGHYLGN